MHFGLLYSSLAGREVCLVIFYRFLEMNVILLYVHAYVCMCVVSNDQNSIESLHCQRMAAVRAPFNCFMGFH